jgi:hypothetical protein
MGQRRWLSSGLNNGARRGGSAGTWVWFERDVIAPPHRAIDRRLDLHIRVIAPQPSVSGVADDGDRDRTGNAS